MIIGSKERMISLDNPIVMGILNVTPDSFYDGGRYLQEDTILDQVDTMVNSGVSIIDIGGMSSRPGATIISAQEEIDRVAPVIHMVRKKYPELLLSIDTLRSSVAQYACEEGCDMINDISGGTYDDKIISIAADRDITYVCMHMQGLPHNMQDNPQYSEVVKDILDSFAVRLRKLKNDGLKSVIIDPGFGFGKSVQDNYKLLSHLHVFKILDVPIMVGLSRKSMLYKPLEISPQEALNATTAAHILALMEGASILRVHDVAEAVEAVKVFRLYKGDG